MASPLRARLMEQAPEQVRYPSLHSLPAVAAESSGECSPLLGVASVTPCDRILVRQVAGSFTRFASVCLSHQWVGHAEGCEHAAQSQICEGRVHQLIAASRAHTLIRQGFSLFDEE